MKLESRTMAPIALAAMMLNPATARADDTATPVFSFSGFGTLGVVHSSESNADFTTTIFKPTGAGHSRAWSADVDSLVAAQVSVNAGPKLSAVVQAVSEQRYDNTYIPTVEWANIKYQFTPDFFARVGRVVMPSFLGSAYRKVAYASPWVRPPVEVYSLVPITKNDGVEASYRQHFGDVVNTIQGMYGVLTSENSDGTQARARNQGGIFSTFEYGPLTVHVAYHQAHLSVEALRSFFDAFRAFGPQGIAIADQYTCDGKLIPFGSVGASYDPGPWFLTGEWGTSNGHCFIGKRSGWYAGGGYRFGRFSPYLTYARAKASGTSNPGLTVSALPPFLAGPATGLNAALKGILGSAPAQKTIAIGGRWDFAKNAAFKLQYEHIRLGAGSPGTLINRQPAFQPGGRLDVFSATVDFVF
jgi:hypothetical protein